MSVSSRLRAVLSRCWPQRSEMILGVISLVVVGLAALTLSPKAMRAAQSALSSSSRLGAVNEHLNPFRTRHALYQSGLPIYDLKIKPGEYRKIMQVIEEAIRIIEAYQPPEQASVDIDVRESRGCGCTEAPRGSLYHRYSLDADGCILDAKIVPPTSQNQRTIESDLRHFVPEHLDLPHNELTWKCEQVIRNYDPCISCSCHFLNLTVERG